jgi:MOB kinase activator 1
MPWAAVCAWGDAGSFEYLWADGVKIKDPVKLSAPEYVDALMTWVEEQLNDQSVFPLEVGTTHDMW